MLGGLVVMRWMPGKGRPTMDGLADAEIAKIAAPERAEKELSGR
jgi:hypothetical protein